MSGTTNKQHIQSTGEKAAGKDKLAIEQAAARALLNDGVGFKIKGVGKFKMKPLKLYTLVSIAKHAAQSHELGEKTTANEVIATSPINARIASKMAANAILNSRFKIKLFGRFFSWILLAKLTPSEMKDMVSLIISQSQVEDFFFCIQSMQGMRMMKPTTKGERPSGEQSPE